MKNKSKEQNKLSSQRAITLIALVVTIVVLLILAGASMSLVLGENGIIAKAQEAKVETRAGGVDDEVNLWKTDNYLADNTSSTAETEEEMIARLRENNLITDDDEIDTKNKIIKIKKKDGTMVREISYKKTEKNNYIISNINKDNELEIDIGLINKENNQSVTFQKAYVTYNGEKIDISSIIKDNTYIKITDVADYLLEIGKTQNWYEIDNMNLLFAIEKEGKMYTNTFKIMLPG